MKKTDTKTLISALRILSNEIQSEDGVANAAIAEAADRLEELALWQPIETAPKDGTPIIGRYEEGFIINGKVIHPTATIRWIISTQGYTDGRMFSFWEDISKWESKNMTCLSFKATHWMPLPEPPTKEE